MDTRTAACEGPFPCKMMIIFLDQKLKVNKNQSTSPRPLQPTFCHFVNFEIKQFTVFNAKGQKELLQNCDSFNI